MLQLIVRSFLNLGLVPMLTYISTQTFQTKLKTFKKSAIDAQLSNPLKPFSNLPVLSLPRPANLV